MNVICLIRDEIDPPPAVDQEGPEVHLGDPVQGVPLDEDQGAQQDDLDQGHH